MNAIVLVSLLNELYNGALEPNLPQDEVGREAWIHNSKLVLDEVVSIKRATAFTIGGDPQRWLGAAYAVHDGFKVRWVSAGFP